MLLPLEQRLARIIPTEKKKPKTNPVKYGGMNTCIPASRIKLDVVFTDILTHEQHEQHVISNEMTQI